MADRLPDRRLLTQRQESGVHETSRRIVAVGQMGLNLLEVSAVDDLDKPVVKLLR